MPRILALGSKMRAPMVKCPRLKTMNSATAAGSISLPNAKTVSGNPMFAVLVNIIGGTKACGL